MANLSNINNKFIVTDGNNGRVLIGATNDIGATLFANHPSTTAPSLTFNAPAGQVFENEDLQIAFGLNNASPYNGYMQTRFVSAPYYRNLAINPLGGNVGIGTNSPGEKLDVAGKVQVTGTSLTIINASDPSVAVSSTDTNYKGLMTWRNSGSENVLEFVTRYGGTYYTNNLVLDRGNVGIGTSSPSSYDAEGDDLVIYNAVTPGITIALPQTTAAGSARGSILFSDGTSGNQKYRGGVIYDHGTGMGGVADTMYLRAAVNSYLALNALGNVGIGTKTPGSKLEVTGDVTKTVSISQTRTDTSTSLATMRSFYAFGITQFRGGVTRGLYMSNVTDNLPGIQVVDSSNNAGPLSIQPYGGSVGIGTTSPGQKLHVIGKTISSVDLTVGNNSSGAVRYSGQNGYYSFITRSNYNDWSLSLLGTDGDASTDPIGTQLVTVNYTGKVGIGTTNPSSGKLVVEGDNYVITNSGKALGGIDLRTDANPGSGLYTGGISFGGASTGRAAIAAYQGSNDGDRQGLAFFTHGSGTGAADANERMRITDAGEVDIVGTVKSGGNQRFGGGPAHGNSSNPGITTKANGTAGVYWNSNGSGGWGGGNFTTNNSDRNMKTNIVPMDIDALQIIDSLETKYFNWTEKANKGDTSIRKAGIIAQDLRELMPEGVYGTEWDDDDENTNGLSLDENATTALLIKAIQELKAEIELLKSK